MDRYGISFKKYPVCYCGHRATDGILQLARDHDLSADAIEAIDVHISDLHAKTLRNALPQTGLEAKFSAEFDMAAGVIARKVGLAELTNTFVRRDDVQALMRRVRVHASAEYDAKLPGYRPVDEVIVTLADGRQIAADPVARATGHADLPLGPGELWAKFADCAAQAGWSETRARAMFDALTALDRMPGVAALISAGTPAQAAE